jgi:hypothetical protein
MSPGKVLPPAGSTRGGSKAIYPGLVRLASRARFEAVAQTKRQARRPPLLILAHAIGNARPDSASDSSLNSGRHTCLHEERSYSCWPVPVTHILNNFRSALHDNLVVDKPRAGGRNLRRCFRGYTVVDSGLEGVIDSARSIHPGVRCRPLPHLLAHAMARVSDGRRWEEKRDDSKTIP